MPILRLTDLGLLNLAPPPKLTDFWDASLPTFGVRVSPKGTKTFVLKLRTGRQAIGRYPIITLSQARSEAKRILAERTLGKIRPQSITYPQAVRLFIEDKKQSSRQSTADQYEWFLGRLAFTCQITDIHPSDIERALKRIKSRSTYDHVLVSARIFFNWAQKRRYVSDNPTAGITRPQSTPRARVLSDDELKSIWEACGKTGEIGLHTPAQRRKQMQSETSVGKKAADPDADFPRLPESFKTIVRLLILTGQRRGEIAALQTSSITSKTKRLRFQAASRKTAGSTLSQYQT